MDRSTLLKVVGALLLVLLTAVGALGLEMFREIARNSEGLHRVEGRLDEIQRIQQKFMDIWFRNMNTKPGDYHPE